MRKFLSARVAALSLLFTSSAAFSTGARRPFTPDDRPRWVLLEGGETRKKWTCQMIATYLSGLYETHSFGTQFKTFKAFTCGIGMDGTFHWKWQLLVEAASEENRESYYRYLLRHTHDTFDKKPAVMKAVDSIALDTEFWSYSFDLSRPEMPLDQYAHIDRTGALTFKNYNEFEKHCAMATKVFEGRDLRQAIFYQSPYFQPDVYEKFLEEHVKNSHAIEARNIAALRLEDKTEQFLFDDIRSATRSCLDLDRGPCRY
jgi:hypothetical protein